MSTCKDSYPIIQLVKQSVKTVRILSWSTSHQLALQTVSQDSYLKNQLVNKLSTSLSNSQSRQLFKNSAGQQVISYLFKQSVITQISNHSAGQQMHQIAYQTVIQDSYLITFL